MNWWKRLFGRRRLEAQLDAELRDHVERQVADYVKAGMSERESRRRTRLEFGGLDQVKELCRDVRGTRWLEQIVQDVDYSVRLLRKTPGISSIALLSLALGVGAPLASYSLVRALLVNEVTASEPERLNRVEVRSHSGNGWSGFSYPEYRDLLAAGAALQLAAYVPARDCQMVSRLANDLSAVSCSIVSANYFEVLGITMPLGRAFTSPSGVTSDAAQPIVISHRFWRQRLGSEAQPVGRAMVLNNASYVVAAVLPADFRSVEPHGLAADVYVPVDTTNFPELNDRSARRFDLLVRLPAGVAQEHARQIFMSAVRELPRGPEASPDASGPEVRLTAVSGIARIQQDPDAQPLLLLSAVLLGLVAVVLLVACANVAGLLLARGAARRGEIAIRLALGASRRRVIQQVLTESLVLAVLGAALALLAHFWLGHAVKGTLLPFISAELRLATDRTLLTVTMILTAGSTLLCGFFPALSMTKTDVVTAIKRGEHFGIRHGLTVRHALVVGQVAGSMLLLVIAAAFGRSLWSIIAAEPGFEVSRILVLELHHPRATRHEDRDRNRQILAQGLERLSATPEIERVSSVGFLPLSFMDWTLRVLLPNDQHPTPVSAQEVGPDYFSTLGIPLLRGREFERADVGPVLRVALVNETFAQRLVAGIDPVGQILRLVPGGQPGADTPLEIIGVVRDSKYRTLGEASRPVLYLPHRGGSSAVTFVLRHRGSERNVSVASRRTLAEVAPSAVVEAKTMRSHVDLAVLPSRAATALLTGLGGVGLLLAVVGVYGVVAHSVERRRFEIGVRMALGATPVKILKSILSFALALVAIGQGIGAAGALTLGGPLSDVLASGSRVGDPTVLLGTAAFVALVGVGAAFWPARRAMRVDPAIALRYE
jgi:predicted permease